MSTFASGPEGAADDGMVPVEDWVGETFVEEIEPGGEVPVKVDVELDDKALAQTAVLTFLISVQYIIGHVRNAFERSIPTL